MIIHFFSKAAPDTLIFKFKKSIYKNNTKIFKLTNKKISLETLTKQFINALITLSSNNTFDYTQKQSFTHTSSWNLSSYDENELVPFLNEATIYVGLVNGADKIFHLSKTIIETFNEEEKHLFIKPIIKAHNLKNGKIENINESMYLYFDKKYTEEELKEYQNVYHYLLIHKEMLSKRVGMKHWWEYTALRNIEKMKQNKLKIITPHITRKQNDWFSLSNENYFIGGDMLIIEGKDDKHTLEIFKILSSKEFENYYQESGAKKGNRIVFTHKLLKELKIPKNML